PAAALPGARPAPDDRAGRAGGTASGAAGGSAADAARPDPGGTFVFRRPAGGAQPAAPAREGATDEGTMKFRAVSLPADRRPNAAAPAVTGPGFGAGKAAAAREAAAQPGSTPQAPAPAGPAGPHPAPGHIPHQSPAPSGPAPLTSGPGGGQASWAQQVHRLAGAEQQPVAPWKPPVEDVFQAAARRQAAARPAGLGKRLAARLLDTVVLLAVTAVPAVPLGTRAVDHVDEKIEAAKLSGETVTVWLIDGTTGGYLGVVLAVLLLFGVLYEVLPTAKWGRTLGKKLLGLEVRDIEGHEPPVLGASLRRWLVCCLPGLLVIGVVGVAWCLFDRPWRQCWHDKAAGTFVAG
ncbi:RDD family protein, partial [Streptomyces ziwulingensis]|uniref:RDD family protein n=1 Tax=Streptomyces ziwulingensis TaxID=1045501 RepID=UPI0031F0CC25